MRPMRLALLLAFLTGLCSTPALPAQEERHPGDDDICQPWLLSGEYLVAWVRRPTVVPVVTTGTGINAGGLADPNTTILFDSRQLNFNPTSGLRAELAYVIMPGMTASVGGWVLGDVNRQFNFASDNTGNPFLFRPFFNVEPNSAGANSGVVISFPGQIIGNVLVTTDRRLFGTNADLTIPICGDEDWQLSMSGGAEYLFLKERFQINDSSTSLANGQFTFQGLSLPAGSILAVTDQFNARNQFYGARIGMMLEGRVEKFWAGLSANLGLGDSHREIGINGSTLATVPGAATLFAPAGLLALPSNSGTFTRDTFTAVPDLDVHIGWDITNWLRAVLGYQVVIWPDVNRASELVPSQISGVAPPSSPAFGRIVAQFPGVPGTDFRTTTLWVQGVHAGLEIRF